MIYTMDWFFSSTFTEIIKTLLSIDSIIYWLIAQFFRFIIDISSADFIMTDLLNTIIDRAYVVAGVFALFIMSYALIKGLFDPDGVFKGKNSLGQIIKNLLIAIALVALMPTIFTYLFRFQAIIINNNVIGNIVLGTDSQAMKFKVDGKYQEVSVENVGYENYIKVASNNVAFSALNAFVYADDNDKPIDLSEKPTVGMFLTARAGVLGLASGAGKLLTSITQDNSENTETTFNQLRNNIVITGNFLEINTIAYHVATGGDYSNESGAHVTYLFIVSTICGIAMLFLTFAFCINIVVRMFNLFLLELISPIASFSLVIPNSKIFDNWFKAAMKEYLDLFVRLFTFNLAILFFSNINQIIVQVIEGHGNVGLISIMNILFVIGLLIFINEAPKLVKDILGMKDDKKGIKDRLFSGGVSKTLGGALGLLGGSAAAGMGIAHALGSGSGDVSGGRKAWNAIKGAASGFGAGKNASKAKSFSDFTGAVGKSVSAMDANRKKGDLYYKQHGGTFKSAMLGRLEDAKNYVTGASPTLAYDSYTEQENKLKDIRNNIDSINELADKESRIQYLKGERDKYENSKTFEDYIKNELELSTSSVNEYRSRIAQDKALGMDTSATEALLKKEQQRKFKLEHDENYKHTEYSNYLVDRQNTYQRLDTEYKTERANYINEQAKDRGSDINLAVEKINRDLIKEANARNVFMEGVALETDVTSIEQIDKYIDDVKNKIFGETSIYNNKEVAIDFNTAALLNSETGLVANIGQKVVKKWDSNSHSYVIEDAGIGEIAKAIAKYQNAGFGELSSADKKAITDAIREKYNDSETVNTDVMKKIAEELRKEYNSHSVGDTTTETNAHTQIMNLINSSGMAGEGITYEILRDAIFNMNAGASRDHKAGTIEKIHKEKDYLDAKQAHDELYEQKKENK